MLRKTISYLYYVLFLITPIIFFTKTTELFEFNKIVFVYLITTIITALWIIRIIVENKSINDIYKGLGRKTILDIPLLVFLFIQLLSVNFSIDPLTSIFGYYGRYNGGVLSTITFTLLYFGFVNNMGTKETIKSIFSLLIAGFVVSIFAVSERFGYYPTCVYVNTINASGNAIASFTRNCWHQDLQSRVFSTLGQPNWLAAFIVTIIPITWAMSFFDLKLKIRDKDFKIHYSFWIALSLLFFSTILFTDSRSGLFGFMTAFIVFWGYQTYLETKFKKIPSRNFLKMTLISIMSMLILIITFGSAWNGGLINKNLPSKIAAEQRSETFEIRTYIWKGAYNIFRENPILGTGVETFAYSFPKFKPVEHNQTFEWEYVYNKAHNEYLNHLANTGVVGFVAYITVVTFSIYMLVSGILKNTPVKKSSDKKYFLKLSFSNKIFSLALLSGYLGLLVTNIVGFSVVSTSLLFSLFPAFSYAIFVKKVDKKNKLSLLKIATIIFVFALTLKIVLAIVNYWKADYFYESSRENMKSANLDEARKDILNALDIRGYEALYWSQLSTISTREALVLNEKNDQTLSELVTEGAIRDGQTAINLSFYNPIILKDHINNLIQLSLIDTKYLIEARDLLENATLRYPNDAKLLYNLALAQLRTNQSDKAMISLDRSISLKNNYTDPRYAKALLLRDSGDIESALKELDLLLEIDPQHTAGLQLMENLK